MFKLFKRTAPTSETVEDLPKKEYPLLSVFVYGSDGASLKRIVAPDFTSSIIKVSRNTNYVTIYYDEGEIDVPEDKVIIVRRYKNEK